MATKKPKKATDIVKSSGNKQVAKLNNKSSFSNNPTIGSLEKQMLKKFPAKNACDWDKTGLLVGNPNDKVKKIAVALDPTVRAVEIAKECSCNLLVTHHPAYLSEIKYFKPGSSVAEYDGALVYSSIKNDVALMNFHTSLDVSVQGTTVLPNLLNLKAGNILCPTDGLSQSKSKFGFGRVCSLKPSDKKYTLKQMAARCKSVFGKTPRVWGDFSKKLVKIATTTGSTGSFNSEDSLLSACIKQKIDCLICGEVKYHDALATSQAGLCIIDLGHDVSELPLVGVLAQSLCDCGISKNNIILVDQTNNWDYQTSTQV